MKKSIWVLTAIAAVLVLGVARAVDGKAAGDVVEQFR